MRYSGDQGGDDDSITGCAVHRAPGALSRSLDFTPDRPTRLSAGDARMLEVPSRWRLSATPPGGSSPTSAGPCSLAVCSDTYSGSFSRASVCSRRVDIEVVPVWRIEATSPSPAQQLPLLAESSPDARRGGGGGSISHSQVNRQSGTWEMAGRGGRRLIRIERRRHRAGAVTADDEKPRPTKPGTPFKMFGRPRVQTVKHSRQSWRNRPSSRHSTQV